VETTEQKIEFQPEETAQEPEIVVEAREEIVEHPEQMAIEDAPEPVVEPQEEESAKQEEEKVADSSTEEVESDYKEGSVCSYCKSCKNCDKDFCSTQCPCQDKENVEQCQKCGNCRYCSLCDTVCKTVCNPGGFLDSFTGSIYNMLPSFSSKPKTEEDMEKTKDFIKEYL